MVVLPFLRIVNALERVFPSAPFPTSKSGSVAIQLVASPVLTALRPKTLSRYDAAVLPVPETKE